MPERHQLLDAALKLYDWLEKRHLRDGLLRGPDPGVRFNWRFGRFLKSAFPFLASGEDYIFMQTQGYWAMSNWLLHDFTGKNRYSEAALLCAESVLRLETVEGFWPYPLPQRRGLIATLESMWGAAVLLDGFERDSRPEFLEGAVRACNFIISNIGFQPHERGEAINYFQRPRGKVPNNSVTAVWFFLRVWKMTGDFRYLEHVPALARFVESVQLSTGEIPYIVDGPNEKGRDHYLCFQYNAFQFLYMIWAEAIRPGTWSAPALLRLAEFLETGVRGSGACAINCSGAHGEVDYYTAALGAALNHASRLGLSGPPDLGQRCFGRLLARQWAGGGFAFSTGDFGFLRDTQSYPRQQAMTLYHLLDACVPAPGV